MLHTNPDGRKQAETGLSWRKNTNQNYCGATSTSPRRRPEPQLRLPVGLLRRLEQQPVLRNLPRPQPGL